MKVTVLFIKNEILIQIPMQKYSLLLLILLCSNLQLSAQFTGFEEVIPQNFQCSDKDKIALSSLYYKEGNKSLEWKFHPGSILHFNSVIPFSLDEQTKETYGITLWIYNEKPGQDSIRFEFLSPTGHVSYHFSFRLAASGWRACWIGFKHMQGDKKTKEINGYRIIAPNYKGRIFLDRITFPVKKINDRTTPDMQMPTNNSLSYRDLWHWCRVWQWEQYTYDLPLPATLNEQEENDLLLVENRLTKALDTQKEYQGNINKAYEVFNKSNIRRSGNGFIGAPVLAPDEIDRHKGEISWNDLETMLSGFAYDAYYNHSKSSLQNYFTVWDFAINQGFAYGSGMGTNHHYGYQVRKIYTTAWLMRNEIWKAPNRNNILSALIFWSALQETRKPYQNGRDELLDSWHTLLMAKTVSALMFTDERERIRALRGLSRWVSTSLQYTPGTIGGIKVDGTTFHHGGFYPAYTTGVLAMVGQFISFTNDTEYEPTEEARRVLRSAFIAMRNYSNKYEWGIGISGRHPFKGSMKEDDVAAFASLALSGDFSGKGNSFDHQLASDYLRLCETDTPEARIFKQQGIQPANAPEGFFVYNYGAAGIFRRQNWMVTLKGYNTDVWSSEIYKKDNRYGRYQSYGSVQIMGQPSRLGSGYDENGWDWNRLPGTTTIHLPFELLDSPLPGTTMAHSKENFAGCSSLENQNGVFAIKLMERDLKNFTPDFVARKSVFCFENRMICLGSGISNSNNKYPTETTLFQSTFHKGVSSININGKSNKESGFYQKVVCNAEQPACLQDGYGNYYFIKDGEVNIQIAKQESRHEKTCAVTHGTFASSWINHGKAPENAAYEYLVWIQPNIKELNAPLKSYKVLQRDNQAHIVHDYPTGITAYALFESFDSQTDKLFHTLPSETIVMYRNDSNKIILSVCDPNLNISEKAYTTKEPSRIIKKQLELNGLWKQTDDNKQTTISYKDGNTILTVYCQHGQPVEMILIQKELY
mgnify:FL=1